VVVPVSVSSSDQGFSFSDVVKNDIFGLFFSDLAFLTMMTYHTKPAKTRNKESFSPVGPVYTHG
jgi:hypothetical protein